MILTFIYASSSVHNAKEQLISCIDLSFGNFANPSPKTKKISEECGPDT
jgi:hypothetical protein